VLPLGALAITRAIPETPRTAGRRPDVRGSAAALLALSGLSIVLILGLAPATPELVAVAAVVGVAAGSWFIRIEHHTPDPLLPPGLLRRRPFVGANVIWLLGAMTCWGAVFFLAVHLQVTLELRPVTAGMLLTPIYLVMMAGSPASAASAGRFGRRRVVVAGLAVYAGGLLLLSTVDAAVTVPWGVLARLAVFAVGMATFTAPLAAAAMSALDDEDQGIASGVNNAMGQLANLLAIIVLPALAGLAGASRFAGPAFIAAYPRALQAAAVLATLGIPVALLTLPPRVSGALRPVRASLIVPRQRRRPTLAQAPSDRHGSAAVGDEALRVDLAAGVASSHWANPGRPTVAEQAPELRRSRQQRCPERGGTSATRPLLRTTRTRARRSGRVNGRCCGSGEVSSSGERAAGPAVDAGSTGTPTTVRAALSLDVRRRVRLRDS